MTDGKTGEGGHAVGLPEHQPAEARLVGPTGTLAADSSFGVALVSLWVRVAQSGATASGFPAGVERRDIATRVATAIDAIKKGWAFGAAVNVDRRLVAFGLVTPGVGLSAHTAELGPVLVDPDHLGQGHGTAVLHRLGASPGAVDRWVTSLPVGSPAGAFFQRFGFREAATLPGWVRTDAGGADPNTDLDVDLSDNPGVDLALLTAELPRR